MNKTKKNVLVTGSAGFLGSHLSEKLSNMGHNVIGIDNDSRRKFFGAQPILLYSYYYPRRKPYLPL